MGKRCNKRAPYLSAEILRVGDGLTRQRGQARVQTQMVGPLTFHYGNGDYCDTELSGDLRQGSRYVRRGNKHPMGELRTCVPFQYGQMPWLPTFTADRSRFKYNWSQYRKPLDLGPFECKRQPVEPMFWGGEWTRNGKDFSGGTC